VACVPREQVLRSSHPGDQAADPDSRQTHELDPDFLEYCHRLGAGGVQVPLGAKDEAYAADLRRRAEGYGMFLEGSGGLPRDPADLQRFEAEVRTAVRCGAKVIRVAMLGGRRYETFGSAETFREFADRARKSLQLAEPLAARHRMPLAIENHKDWRIDELVDMLKRASSEYVGACVDTGNSIALLEDPLETVKAYAPWAMSAHLKDMAVRGYEDGFLLSEVPLGEGFLDLPKIVEVLRQAKPAMRFAVEMITRDPLRVPCLTETYWATLAGVPGRDLARTLRLVRDRSAPQPLPRISHLPPQEQLALEEQNVRKCLSFARERLKL
jgi:sugar phosphate isomerase/epimerase